VARAKCKLAKIDGGSGWWGGVGGLTRS